MSEFINFISTRYPEILSQTTRHLYLTLISLLIAIIIGILLGILLTRFRKVSGFTLAVLGVIQTIPSLALLGFLLPFLGIGAIPAITALFLYALLPIVRNTYTGIVGVEASIIEAARGLGLSNGQILWQVELPLAVPIIFAGIRTATVINVGVATLCALIGAGGLGEFIFRGIALNHSGMVLAGAIPSALLALGLDILLGIVQIHIQKIFRTVIAIFGLAFLIFVAMQWLMPAPKPLFKAAFDAEFSERADGFKGLKAHYQIKAPLETIEMDAGLMYQALHKGQVDLIGGYSTDGRIQAYGLRILQDDQFYFPPYYVVPLLGQKTREKYPFVETILAKIAGKISDSTMQSLNYQVDSLKKSPQEVAIAFLKKMNFKTEVLRQGKGDIVIGGKKFTEQYILAEIFKNLLENYSPLKVEIKGGLGGTQILFGALQLGEIDLYAEYTGTAFLTVLKPEKQLQMQIIRDKQKVYEYVKNELAKKYQIHTLSPLGFNNSYTLMMRSVEANQLKIRTISDLKQYLEKR
ncbi:MAG: ABC transporter permease subunit [Microscillaceae bacterium]|jgi:osmoprotectant transport system permease protein|nr:ABC transporter permease subunit [Microscillaceae bacterium]